MKKIILLIFLTVIVISCAKSEFLSPEEAVKIAKRTKECTDVGMLTNSPALNERTKTYWIDILQEDKPNCAPACVVGLDTRTAEVNWRCVGVIEEAP